MSTACPQLSQETPSDVFLFNVTALVIVYIYTHVISGQRGASSSPERKGNLAKRNHTRFSIRLDYFTRHSFTYLAHDKLIACTESRAQQETFFVSTQFKLDCTNLIVRVANYSDSACRLSLFINPIKVES